MAARRTAMAALVAGMLGVGAAAATDEEPLLNRFDFAQSGEPVEVASDRLEFAYEDRVLTYEGNVTVKQGDIALRADVLAITLEGVEDLRLRAVVARGNVVLTQGQRRATGERAVFDEREQTVVLSGDAVLQDGPNRVSGESIVVDLGLERSVVQGGKGRVQAILYPPTPRRGPEEAEMPAVSGGSDE